MRKLKKFDLNQNRFLSPDEMAKLIGGEEDAFHNSCNDKNIGKPCVVSYNGMSYDGICKFSSIFTTDGTSSSMVKTYFCYTGK